MIIDILSLLTRQEKVIEVNRKIPNFISELNCDKPIEVKGRIHIENQSIKINLNVKLYIDMVCSRCIEEFNYLIDIEIIEDYDMAENQGLLQNDTLDLTELIRESILLHIPIQALCDVSCKGLCAICGENKNIHNCDCDKDQIDPRLSVLNNLLNGDE
ncbi:DUF177 domain-containing protein [Alkalibaculum sp. M08DMB]|uniref:DUF177 domain-containing protein n=1 Tax=Alkalibaculum sporogenes TaxID=2655001 RepID=A0A6A7K965_9FIRM|nr:DUF177 domain-containing protein [Alkalibaculum sporogenes]MPW26049.1 DUF177 domain-containing protein [Alkalibaculum sporogenes]